MQGRDETARGVIFAIDHLSKELAWKVTELNVKYPRIAYLPGMGAFSWYIATGEGLGASPDGRLSGEA